MLIAQISDLHVGYDPGNPEEGNIVRLRSVLRRLFEGPNRPDMLLMTGDLTEYGDAESYETLKQAIADCPVPVYAIPGNHDRRDNFRAAFAAQPLMADGFVQYVVDAGDLRIIFLDTLGEGRHGISFCQSRADWLAAELRNASEKPTLIVMHHPPFSSGIEWMDPPEQSPAIARFHAAVSGHEASINVISGHLHRSVHANWHGISMISCPSTSPPIALDLRPIDKINPDGRAIITGEPAGYALHLWDGARLVSHVEFIEGLTSLADFDEQRRDKLMPIFIERQNPL